ncbi:MAG: hypothetical protein ACHQFX_01740 [Chitinophagales bacterium]
MLRHFLFLAVFVLVLFSSCTIILSTNIPGKSEKLLPKEWLGKYEVISASVFPEKRDSAQHEKEYATIEANRIIWESRDGVKTYSLNDSLRYSVISGQSKYISLLMPQGLYAVFKVIKNADTLELYSLSSEDEPKKAELNKYFSKVEKMKKGDDEYYKVTIVEKKLDAYFKSSIPSKDVIKLVPVR